MKNHTEKIKFKFSKINLKILNYVKKTMDILKKIKINLNEKKYLNLKNNSEIIIMKLIMTIYSKNYYYPLGVKSISAQYFSLNRLIVTLA